MAALREYSINVLLLVIFLGSTAIFVAGYFPLSYSTTERASLDDLPKFIGDAPINRSLLYRSQYTKSVLMVIDALRTDFVINPHDTMQYVNKVLGNGEACLIKIHVQTPTVTLPRIKALTTGSVPNFIDVAQNFGSAALTIDSIIYQLRNVGRKIVFCGDDTWLKLFPDSFERHLENRDSLFVKDFYEGDKNITQRLHTELRHADWDLLILHYLGLDHIGHVEGPHSPRVPVKLQEMDLVAQQIHTQFQDWKQRLALRTLLLVTGDHGMRDTGGHGGNSPPEVNVPLIVAGVNCSASERVYEQIDIVPTMSVLMGLPIPASSIGSLIPEMLGELSEDEQLYALQYNGRRLVQAMHEQVDSNLLSNQEHYIQFNEATRLHERRIRAAHTERTDATTLQFQRIQSLYLGSARAMSHQLATKYVNYDHLSIGVGLCLATATLLTLTTHALFATQRNTQYVHMQAASVLGAVATAIVTKLLLCATNDNTFGVCQASHLSATVIVALIAVAVCFLVSVWRGMSVQPTPQPSATRPPALLFFVVLATILHSAFQLSSSFVEEEHQVWYFFGKAMLLALALLDWRLRRDTAQRQRVPGLGADLASRNAQAYMSCWGRWCLRNGETMSWAVVLLAHCGLSHLNQTGDKWLALPDAGDWLVEVAHRGWNSAFVGGALILLVWRCLRFAGVLTNILTATGAVLVYYYRTQTGDVEFPGFKESQPPIMALIFWLNLLEIVCFNFVPVLYRSCMATTSRADGRSCMGAIVVLLCLFGALLHKPHNILLTGMLLWSCDRVGSSCDRIFGAQRTIALVLKTVAHWWLAQMFFYYQGNSNSLASVDLNAGYVAVSSFNFTQVSVFLTVNTYHAFFVSLAVLLYDVFDPRVERSVVVGRLNTVTATMTILMALPTTVFLFVALAFRSHLFVWTVFSPKLLYAFFHAVLVTVCLSFVFLVNNVV